LYRKVQRGPAVRALGNKSIELAKEVFMPVLFIEAPPGIRPEKKRVMMQKITEAIDEAYHIGDTLIFLREYPVENVAMDGRIQSENPKILEALKKIGAGA
jgi:hypothetical protein